MCPLQPVRVRPLLAVVVSGPPLAFLPPAATAHFHFRPGKGALPSSSLQAAAEPYLYVPSHCAPLCMVLYRGKRIAADKRCCRVNSSTVLRRQLRQPGNFSFLPPAPFSPLRASASGEVERRRGGDPQSCRFAKGYHR